MPEHEISLSAGEARKLALAAQGLLGPRPNGGPTAMLDRLQAVQLDTISVLARSHELVAYARLGPIGRERIEQAYWGPKSATFEYWSHAACILPARGLAGVRLQTPRPRRSRAPLAPHGGPRESCAYVRDRIRAEGPLSARELGGAKKGGPWWDWSETKIAAEWLLDTGELVCRQRKGFERVYDLAERAVPPHLFGAELDDAACHLRLVTAAAAALGVATTADLAAYHGLTRARVDASDRRSRSGPGARRGMGPAGLHLRGGARCCWNVA